MTKISVLKHIDNIATKITKSLGFIKRKTDNIDDIDVISILYLQVVRSVLT